ncbi:hypothetical protein [Zavarzinella formosa]|uniref:hypothetical protein n=1 Tax=Zavarzinella formosa TaxID=360055 RepID=UPI0002FA12D6|nr:hypothetical protein [Zavarzinella formosa]
MTDPQQTEVENALLRGTLFLTANALKEYHDAPHFEIDDDGVPKVEVIVTELTRGKAADALKRADGILKGRSA